MELSQITKKILVDAGWSASRHIDIQQYVEALNEDGYKRVFKVINRIVDEEHEKDK